MKKVRNVAIAATALFALTSLGGCQLAQSGSSTYAGTDIGKPKSLPGKRLTVWADSPQPKTVTEDSAIDAPEMIITKPAKRENTVLKKRMKKTPAKSRKTKESRNVVVKKSARLPRKKRRAIKTARFSGAYDTMIRRYASANGVPYGLARAVVQVESNFRPNARGKVGEIGLMQLRKNTARGMGYRGTTRGLYKPETNIKFGMRYLGKAYRLGGKSTCGAILKYNAGHGAKKMNPISRRYCNKVRKIMGS